MVSQQFYAQPWSTPAALCELLAHLAYRPIIQPDYHSPGGGCQALLPLLRRGAVATVLLLDPVTFGGAGEVSGTLALLTNLGVTRYVIPRELLDRPEARPGQQGNWEWRIMPTGRAVPIRRPGNTPWRALS
jgi:hypothetical protein